MKKILWLLLLLIPLFGCATTGGQAEFYRAQQNFALSLQGQKYLELKATPGKAIENLESLTVYAPSQGSLKDFKQYAEMPHPAWETANTLLRVGGQVAGIYFIADGIKSIFGSFTSLANRPSSVSNTTNTNTISGTGNSGYISPMTVGNVRGHGNVFGGFYTATPTVVNQPPPVVITQPAPIIVAP